MNLKGKRVTCTGGGGLVGQPLVKQLLEKGAKVKIISLDDPSRNKNPDVEFIRADLRDFTSLCKIMEGTEICFSVAGIKGSPALTRDQPLDFFTPMVQLGVNTIEAARLANVEWLTFFSSVGAYGPSERFFEDDLWKSNPSFNDWEAGWAKRLGEIQLEAQAKQYKKRNFSILRPCNIHGPYDNFSSTGMVIPSLIKRALESKDKLKVFGDGTPVRDFVNSTDCARAAIFCVENEISQPVNVGSGVGYTIKELVETILKYIPHKLEIEWDNSFPAGDKCRVSDCSRLFGYGFKLSKTLDESIKETIDWYIQNKDDTGKRYDAFIHK